SRSCLFSQRSGCGTSPMLRRAGALAAVALAELVDAAGRVHHLLLAGIERMAGRTDFHVERLAHGGARLELVAAAAGDVDLGVLRMNGFFHGVLCRVGTNAIGA